ncbi:MAG: acyl-CoA dehydrogenase family protein [Planctomycetia bacterium]|nr:acyl-CoA dehydrogenase family protein [Planctomycetia bacterium]
MAAVDTQAPPSTQCSFLFDAEHEAFRAEVRRYVEQELNPRSDAWDESGRIPREEFLRAGELGLFGLAVPEAYGGSAGDCRMPLVMAEEMARARSRGVSMGFGAHSAIAMPHLVRFGTDEQKARYLADLVAGRRIAALGVTEPTAGSNVAGMKSTVTRDGAGWVLRGEKMFITNSVNGDLFFVAAKTNPAAGHRGVSMFLVERKTPGFSVEELKGKLGRRASDTGRLRFDNCRLPADALLGQENHGFYQIMQCFEHERLVIAGGCVGAADMVLEETQKWVQNRVYGEGTLADMQVTKQRLAKSATELEAARQLVYYCARRVMQSIPSLKEVAMAKAFCAEAAFRIIDDCLQLHGGYGYFDSPVERAYRDIRLDRIGGGATEVMYDIIAKQMGI